jgi:hypothetical protein
VVGLGFGLPIFVLLSGNGGVVFESVTPSGNGNGLGVVQETIQDRAGCGHVAQEFAPFLQRPVAGHDGGPALESDQSDALNFSPMAGTRGAFETDASSKPAWSTASFFLPGIAVRQ